MTTNQQSLAKIITTESFIPKKSLVTLIFDRTLVIKLAVIPCFRDLVLVTGRLICSISLHSNLQLNLQSFVLFASVYFRTLSWPANFLLPLKVLQLALQFACFGFEQCFRTHQWFCLYCQVHHLLLFFNFLVHQLDLKVSNPFA